ncbi:hypothetical protein [Flavonifractor sp. An100]|uniref:hypothetical protein n=1 Tax=Flavonifractor sp. An100 TaxID=1965538 RepID=UPI001302D82D|nr:hypothetical protein [Flavonifractor sp. An100]
MKSKPLAQGGLIPPEHFNPSGPPQNSILRGLDDKQLDDLSIAVTRKEQEETEG